MSDKVPVFQINDTVRVMQTHQMVELGLANQIGTIYSQRNIAVGDIEAEYEVRLESGFYIIQSSSLMKIETKVFQDGDTVRIMQTDQMVKEGLANKVGTIISGRTDTGMYAVQLSTGKFVIPGTCLIKHREPLAGGQ